MIATVLRAISYISKPTENSSIETRLPRGCVPSRTQQGRVNGTGPYLPKLYKNVLPSVDCGADFKRL